MEKSTVFGIKADERENEAWRFAVGSMYKDRSLQQAGGGNWGHLLFGGKDTDAQAVQYKASQVPMRLS